MLNTPAGVLLTVTRRLFCCCDACCLFFGKVCALFTRLMYAQYEKQTFYIAFNGGKPLNIFMVEKCSSIQSVVSFL